MTERVLRLATYTLPVWCCWIIGNASAALGFRQRDVVYQLAPIVRTRTETTRNVAWLVRLHWWARERYEELTDDDWLDS